ncbi:4-hydroxy-tetrahydrodipicolinate synthase [Georgenia alba]|uniref:4-hydroxy-tetrahydrodipicolinate synthase n=1 Tax=Georgenia alba TaxID=2233858 RepID=A0ABW2Q839_9MICO
MSTSPRLPSRTFGSVAVAMVTPFREDRTVDVDAGVAVAVKLVEDGCDALVIHGTTGESSTTHQPEKDELMRAVVDAVGDKAMIIGGAGSNDTAHAVRIAQGAQRCGAQGLLVVSPYYNRPSQEGVYQHVRAVTDAVDLPVMLYDIPGRTGVAFGDETLDRLAQHPRILAVKDATGDVPTGFERIARTGLEYYSGDDALNFDWLAHGASGVVSVVGHVTAADYVEMVRAVDDGDLPGARDVAARLRPVVAALMGTGQGAVMAKHALHLQGVIPTPAVRLPLVTAPEADVAELAAALREHGYLERAPLPA